MMVKSLVHLKVGWDSDLQRYVQAWWQWLLACNSGPQAVDLWT